MPRPAARESEWVFVLASEGRRVTYLRMVDRPTPDASLPAEPAESAELTAILGMMRTVDLRDIYIEGYVDDGHGVNPTYLVRKGIRHFVSRWSAVYLDLEGTLVRLSVDEPSAGVKVASVTSFTMGQEVDEEDEPAITSLGALLMNMEGQGVRLTRFEAFLGTPEQTRAGIFRALGFAFPHPHSAPPERYLFVDPLNLDGIAIGRREEREAWITAAPGVVAHTWSF